MKQSPPPIEKRGKKIRNYKKMVEDINKLIDNDWGFDMIDGKLLHNTPYTPSESEEVQNVLGQIYSITHRIYCDACLGKYELKTTKKV